MDDSAELRQQLADVTNERDSLRARLGGAAAPADPTDYDYRTDLGCYFGLSYASWLTLPRVLMEAMPQRWQKRMAMVLHEYDDAIKNPPQLGTTVRVTLDGKLIQTPSWVINYRHPDRAAIAQVFGEMPSL